MTDDDSTGEFKPFDQCAMFIMTSSFMFHFLFYLLFCPYLCITFAMLLCLVCVFLSITFVVRNIFSLCTHGTYTFGTHVEMLGPIPGCVWAIGSGG